MVLGVRRAVASDALASGLRLLGLIMGLLAALTACSVLPQPKPSNMHRYVLEYGAQPGPVPVNPRGPVLIVAVPQVAAMLNTTHMAYVTRRYGLRYFAHNEWADTPAHMLAPMIVGALQSSGRFAAVLQQPVDVPARLRLDSTLIRFQQDFTVQPSRLEVALRVRLIDLRTQRVVATRVFAVNRSAAKGNPYAGVVAANDAVQALLGQLTRFCVAHAGADPGKVH